MSLFTNGIADPEMLIERSCPVKACPEGLEGISELIYSKTLR